MSVAYSIELKVSKVLQAAGIGQNEVTLLVAVSGGPDSLTLLAVLVKLCASMNLRLHIAHLNHGYRGPESDADASFVREIARKYNLPHTIGTEDLSAYHQSTGGSWEAAARDLRYKFLASVAQDIGAKAAVVGHTLNDQAETVLMHVIRGSGLTGLRGMSMISSWRREPTDLPLTVIRPLLEVKREDVLVYCLEEGLAPRIDSSNTDLKFTRNAIRHRCMPLLSSMNPRIHEALSRLAKTITEDSQIIDKAVNRLWNQSVTQETNALRIDSKTFLDADSGLRRHLFRRAYHHLHGNTDGLDEKHIAKMLDLAHASAGKSLDLPHELKLVTSYRELLFGKDLSALCPFSSLHGIESTLTIPGEIQIPGWRVIATLIPTFHEIPYHPLQCRFNLASVGTELSIRTRRPGDRFQPLGMQKSKKLQDFFVDEHVPVSWRDRVPLIIGHHGIAWVVGYRQSDWSGTKANSREAILLHFQPVKMH